MKKYIFSDLDKSLIFSSRSIPDKVKSSSICCFSRGCDNSRGLWVPKPYLDMINSLDGEIVIVTAREKKDVDKLELPFNYSYLICNFGAEVYGNDRRLNTLFNNEDAVLMSDFIALLSENNLSKPLKYNLVNDLPAVAHYVFSTESEAKEEFERIKGGTSALKDRLSYQINGRHFDIFPRNCGKEKSVEWLIKNFFQAPAFYFGVGDSIIDHEFLKLCDIAITPTNSQLFNNIGEN